MPRTDPNFQSKSQSPPERKPFARTGHMLGIPGLRLSWQITKVVVSRSGDLAYVQSTYQASFEDTQGKPAIERGKAVTIWKKQEDGVWKAVADISNTDSPPPSHKPPRTTHE